MHEYLLEDPERYYKLCDGFTSMVKHPHHTAAEIETQQRECFKEDFETLGPTLYRSIDTWLAGYEKLRTSVKPALRGKAERFAREIRNAYPIFLTGKLFAPNRNVRARIARLEKRVYAALGRPTLKERVLSIGAIAAAAKTSLELRFNIGQDPKLVKHAYRMPSEAPRLALAWRRLREAWDSLAVEQRPERTVWVKFEGRLSTDDAARVAEQVRDALRRTRDHIVLDLERLVEFKQEAAAHLVARLHEYEARIRILIPPELPRGAAAALAVFTVYA